MLKLERKQENSISVILFSFLQIWELPGGENVAHAKPRLHYILSGAE